MLKTQGTYRRHLTRIHARAQRPPRAIPWSCASDENQRRSHGSTRLHSGVSSTFHPEHQSPGVHLASPPPLYILTQHVCLTRSYFGPGIVFQHLVGLHNVTRPPPFIYTSLILGLV
ncbi:hypothetical protein NQD34_011094 [Periophthalmus magnuspinnatus]|nr:hypothetical protein NQD34_011094 [Periophthalmus magnuspinnatus]